MIRTTITTAALAAATFVVAPASAVLTFTTNEAAFTAGLSNPVSEDFGIVAPGSPTVDFFIADGRQAIGNIFVTPFGTESGFGATEIRSAGATEPASEADLFFFLDSAPTAYGVTVDFGAPVTAFGADFFSAASLGGSTLTLDTGTDSFAIGDSPLGSPGTGFLGFTSDTPFSTIDFTVTDPTSFEGLFIRDVVFDVVPEPTSAAVIGLAGLATLRRRRA